MKKILCFVLALCLAFTAAAEIYTVSTPMRTAQVRLEDEWFENSSYEYNHDLMRAMLELAMTGMGTSENYGLTGDFGRERYAEKAAADLKLEGFKAYNFDKSLNDPSDYTAYYIANRVLDDGSRLIVCVARCMDYGCGFASNFAVGNGDVHKGFFAAGSEMAQSVAEYAKGFEGEQLRIALTGYSRAAAAANIAAKLLDDMAFEGSLGCAPENIFTCAFAVPTTVKEGREGEGDALYCNIFSVINWFDIVPEAPMTAWGYTRYGNTLVFAKGETVPEKVQNAYMSMTGRALDVAGRREKVEKTVASMVKQVRDTEQYSEYWESLFVRYLCAMYGRVNASSIDTEIIETVRSRHSGTDFGRYILEKYDALGEDWVSDPLLALIMFEGEKALDSGLLVSVMPRSMGDTAYAALISYLTCMELSADEIPFATEFGRIRQKSKYMPMLATFAGFMECFAGHDFSIYISYLMNLDADEAFNIE